LVTKSKRKSTVFEEKSNCQQDYEYLDHPKLEEDATRLIILIPSHKSRPWCTSLWFKSSFFFCAIQQKKQTCSIYSVYSFSKLLPQIKTGIYLYAEAWARVLADFFYFKIHTFNDSRVLDISAWYIYFQRGWVRIGYGL